jgi:hypothetical protein
MKIRADQRVGLLLAGVVLLAFVALGATVVLPASDPTLDVKAVGLSKIQSKGMEIYRSEGLWYCSTAYARETGVDLVSLATRATKPEDVGDQSPVMLGLERVGRAPGNAEVVASDCGVELSGDEIAAVQAFLDSRIDR